MPEEYCIQCLKLPPIGSEFAWNFHEDTASRVNQIDIFFGTRLHAEIGWLAWGVNPTNVLKMISTRAIIGRSGCQMAINLGTASGSS
ncbi:hypothetical protein QYF36_026817 [Acer negundo]|nr:hypothetical protein QYF36_026817 [Acer negundo]